MNLQKPHFIDLHKDIVHTSQDHIPIDLLGPYNISSQGNSYTLTPVCNLTDYDHPYEGQNDNDSSNPPILDITLKFSFPRKLNSDNGMEFQSKLIEYLSQQCGIKKTFISPSPPTS